MNLKKLLFFLSLLAATAVFSQEKSTVKFGKVSPEDFAPKVYSIDSTANAVIIADIGATKFVGKKAGFSLEFTAFRRVHILNKNGYEAGNVEIPIYTNGDMEEELSTLKAVTYNLENGKVVETKLDKKSAVFKDRINKNLVVKKFTFPNLKEGTIIEYEYKLTSDFTFNLQPWTFQGEFPCLWSEYNVGMPEFFYYVTLTQGSQQFYIKDQKDKVETFAIEEDDSNRGASGNRVSFSTGLTNYRWVMKNVPALNEESYTSTLDNHMSKIEFQLAEVRPPVYTQKSVMSTWVQTTEDLLKDEDFGADLSKENEWLDDVIRDATSGASTSLEKAKRIFAYIRDNMTCTNFNRRSIDKPLRTVLKNRSGSVAEINLLLTAMLKKAGFLADPVLLSTRSHGFAYAAYPLVQRFNYVIVQLDLAGKKFYLDASNPRLGFGKLGYECYNGHARVINAEATPMELTADSLREAKITSLFIINSDNGAFSGNMNQTPGFYESYSLRNRIKDKGKEQLFDDIRKAFNSEIEIKDPKIDSLDKFEYPLSIHYQFDMKKDDADILYLNPMFGEGWKENPFKSARRLYPVEMPYCMDETYLLRLDVPKGYVIDELPKQVKVKLNESDDGAFEYLITESNGTISMRSRIQLKRAYYSPEEYDTLREFFNLVVKKHSEQIVFKKKK